MHFIFKTLPYTLTVTGLYFFVTHVLKYFTWEAHLIRLHFTGDARCVCVCVLGVWRSLTSHREENKKRRLRERKREGEVEIVPRAAGVSRGVSVFVLLCVSVIE